MPEQQMNLDPRLYAMMLETMIARRDAFESGERCEVIAMNGTAGGQNIVLRFSVEKRNDDGSTS